MGQLRANAEFHMCERCIEIDSKIERYQRLTAFTDQLTRDRIAELVGDLRREKAALHSEPQSGGREKRGGCV
jgi:hypothetical protein